MFWATGLTYASRTYGVECARQVLVDECAQNSLQHKLRQPCERVGRSYSTSHSSMKSSKDTPFGLQGMKPNLFSKESQLQRASKQIVQPWPVSHYFLKWWPCISKKKELCHISVVKLKMFLFCFVFFPIWEQVLSWGPVSFGVTTNTWNLFFSGVAWHLKGVVITDLLCRLWQALLIR